MSTAVLDAAVVPVPVQAAPGFAPARPSNGVHAPPRRWHIADFDLLPADGTRRHEILDGVLFVSTQPSWEHQWVSKNTVVVLDVWSQESGAGYVNVAPGVIFDSAEAAAPDVVWVSRERLARLRGTDGKLHGAPDLVVEVLSPGATNARRDREIKLALYTRQGVQEYWLVNWPLREILIYRREEGTLRLVATLHEPEVLTSPLLPGFACPVARLFQGL